MENSPTFSQNVFDYIDSLSDEVSVKNLIANLDTALNIRTFWESFKIYFTAKSPLERQKARLKCSYVNRYFGSNIPLNANINRFRAPHGFYGIFISSEAKIGKDCTIFQSVTIGSNTLPDSKNAGAPIIGKVKIGNNVRIGAGCSVTRDIPDNCTAVQAAPIVIQKQVLQDNRFITMSEYRKIKAQEADKNSTPPQNRLIFLPTMCSKFKRKIFIGRLMQRL